MKKKYKKISKLLLNELKEQLKSIRFRQKPSYLWELSFGDCDHVFDVCHQFNIDLIGLKVIQINDLLFVSNFDCLLRHLRNLLNESFVAFIDVSPDLQLPQLLSEERIELKKTILRNLLNELELNSDKEKLRIQSNSDWDLCLICGSLLGYPIVYCNNNPQNGNCLSGQPLCVYSVEKLSQNNSIETIYSFSLPLIHKHLFESDLNSWFESISCGSSHQSLSLKTQIKTMPFVLT